MASGNRRACGSARTRQRARSLVPIRYRAQQGADDGSGRRTPCLGGQRRAGRISSGSSERSHCGGARRGGSLAVARDAPSILLPRLVVPVLAPPLFRDLRFLPAVEAVRPLKVVSQFGRQVQSRRGTVTLPSIGLCGRRNLASGPLASGLFFPSGTTRRARSCPGAACVRRRLDAYGRSAQNEHPAMPTGWLQLERRLPGRGGRIRKRLSPPWSRRDMGMRRLQAAVHCYQVKLRGYPKTTWVTRMLVACSKATVSARSPSRSSRSRAGPASPRWRRPICRWPGSRPRAIGGTACA
jgi:hypothetical protein